MVKISDVMMTDVLTAAKTDTILDMSKRLQAHRIGAIVIVDNNHYPVGIVSERDIIRSITVYKEQTLNKQAQDIMSSPVLTLEPDQDIETAATLMSLNMIRRIPITKNDKLIGIISYRDITNALRKSYYMLEEKTETLEDKANRDPLTGLFNKGYLEEQLKYQFELSKRSGNPMTVMFLDIDFFKKVNDTYGHQCGDDVLKRIAAILKDKSRAINVVGRYGGEEFMVIGPVSDYKSALYLGERIRTAVEKEDFACNNIKFNITISIGISVWNNTTSSVKELVKFADDALYTAKRNGRNQVRMYEGV